MASSRAMKSKSVDYSHFISLPLSLHPEMVTKLNNFQNSVLGNNKDFGIEKSMFINPKTLHLTVQMLKLANTDRIEAAAKVLQVQMLKLANTDRIEAAAKVLQSVSPKVIDVLERQPVYIRLKGLACMKDRGIPEKAYVVHAPLEVIGGKDRLIHACRVMIKAFINAGLVLEEDANHELQLHATIMNARHRSKKKSEKTDPFDARRIFAQYGSEEWGECRIREAHLSQRHVYDRNGYFHCCASIPFPEEKQGVFPVMKNIFQKMFS